MRALFSVSDKTELIPFASGLHSLGIHIVASGGTSLALRQAGLPVTEVSEMTGFSEILDGRVKTLHPKVHGGLLACPHLTTHKKALQQHGIYPIDILVVNFYPFEKVTKNPQCTLEEAIKNIDIGGPAMIRSGAKNWQNVIVITHPNQYQEILTLLQKDKKIDKKKRFGLAVKAFQYITHYDYVISDYLSQSHLASIAIKPKDTQKSLTGTNFPNEVTLHFQKRFDLRYGENPHQKASFYQEKIPLPGSIATAQQLQGKPLSFNNLVDADVAWECVKSLNTLEQSACTIVKHAAPCGGALGKNTVDAYQKAWQSDPVSAFGSIVTLNNTVEQTTAWAIHQRFIEVVIAPDYTDEALKILENKPRLRLLKVTLPNRYITKSWDYKRIGGGLLVQDINTIPITNPSTQVVSQRQPKQEDWQDLRLAWIVASYVKSNAIVLVKNGMVLGIGGGQTSRLGATQLAVNKAKEVQLDLQNSVVASDAFFPFVDGIEVLSKAGINTIITPGGSIRDTEVIAAANKHHITLIFTKERYFRH